MVIFQKHVALSNFLTPPIVRTKLEARFFKNITSTVEMPINRREATKMEHLFTLQPNPYLVRKVYERSNHNTTETIRLVECKYSYTPTLIFSSVSSVVLNT